MRAKLKSMFETTAECCLAVGTSIQIRDHCLQHEPSALTAPCQIHLVR